MKVRTGFVSNSSSSSFVVRGIEMKKQHVADCLGIQESECDFEDMGALFDAIWSATYKKKLGYGKGSLTIEDTRDFFSDDHTETIIVGVNLASLEDGQVCQLSEPDDDTIREKISKLLGRDIDEKLHTYIQYVSNDNY